MFAQPETWVAIAFVILMVLFAYLGIHKTVLTALDQGLAFERRQYPVHRLGGGVAGSREIGARCAGLAREHAQHPVLRHGQAVRAEGHFHGAA